MGNGLPWPIIVTSLYPAKLRFQGGALGVVPEEKSSQAGSGSPGSLQSKKICFSHLKYDLPKKISLNQKKEGWGSGL